MTASQSYFPYFFNHDKFNDQLAPYGLSSYLMWDEKIKMPKELVVTQKTFLSFLMSQSPLLTIPFGASLMVQNDQLYYWSTDYDMIDVTRIELKTLNSEAVGLNQKIDLRQYLLGHNVFVNQLNLTDFVTYTRKEDLTYDQAYHEKFVLVFINESNINIVPFDWFNKIGGDYGYVWPAIAQFDRKKSKLYGQGMRMSNFEIEVENAFL